MSLLSDINDVDRHSGYNDGCSETNATLNVPISNYQTFMLPLLRLAADGEVHRFRDSIEQLAIQFNITDEERNTMLPSGTAPLFDNRIGWARTYLKQAIL